MKNILLAFFLLLLALPLASALQQTAGSLTMRLPDSPEGSYAIMTNDELEEKWISISIDEVLKPYISITPSEPFAMQPNSEQMVRLKSNYTGTERIEGKIAVTASPMGAGGPGATINVRLEKTIVLEPAEIADAGITEVAAPTAVSPPTHDASQAPPSSIDFSRIALALIPAILLLAWLYFLFLKKR